MTNTGYFKVWATGLAAILATILLFAAFTTGAGAQETGCRGQIVLDPGHGGTDPGAVNTNYELDGSYLTEAGQNLAVATKLRDLLELDGYTVCMTRTGDESQALSNNDRYTYANTTGAKVLVSIHMNGSTNTSTDYTTTLFGKPKKDKELATTVFKALSDLPPAPPSTEQYIAKRTPYQFASGVLLKSEMPAIIAETVFITNDGEGKLLSDGTDTRQQQIAEALKVGIEDYLTTR